MQRRRFLAVMAAPGGLVACALLDGREPLKVSLVGIEPLPSQGLELRMVVRLRVQNPNDSALEYDGIALDLAVRGLEFASGVSDARGSVPRYGEAVLAVPVTVPAAAVLKQVYALTAGRQDKLDFVARGRLAGGPLGGTRFSTSGQFDWPLRP